MSAAADTILGNFEVNVDLDGTDEAKRTLGSAKIGGGIEVAVWTIDGDVGKVEALGVDEATINITGDADSLKLGSVEDTDVDVSGSIKKIEATEWHGGSIEAETIDSIKITGDRRDDEVDGDFLGNVTVNPGDLDLDVKRELGGAKVAGTIDGDNWTVKGDSGKIEAAGVDDTTFDISGDAEGLRLGSVERTTVMVGGHLKSLEATQWEQGSIEAQSIGSIKTKNDKKDDEINGDLNATVTVNAGDETLDVKRSLDSAKIEGGVASVNWSVHGDVGKVEIRGEVNIWTLGVHSNVDSLKLGDVAIAAVTVDGNIKTLEAVEWEIGSVTADTIKSLKTKGDKRQEIEGDFDANLTLNGSDDPKIKKTLDRAKIAGSAENATWRITGDVGKVEVGQEVDNWTLIVASDVDGLKLGDVDEAHVSVDGHIKKAEATQWAEGMIAADTLGKLTIKGDRGDDIPGDFGPSLTLSGPDDPESKIKRTLDNAKIQGTWSGDAVITGDVNKLRAGHLHGELTIGGDAKSIQVDDYLSLIEPENGDSGLIQVSGETKIKSEGETLEAESVHIYTVGSDELYGFEELTRFDEVGHFNEYAVDGSGSFGGLVDIPIEDEARIETEVVSEDSGEFQVDDLFTSDGESAAQSTVWGFDEVDGTDLDSRSQTIGVDFFGLIGTVTYEVHFGDETDDLQVARAKMVQDEKHTDTTPIEVDVTVTLAEGTFMTTLVGEAEVTSELVGHTTASVPAGEFLVVEVELDLDFHAQGTLLFPPTGDEIMIEFEINESQVFWATPDEGIVLAQSRNEASADFVSEEEGTRRIRTGGRYTQELLPLMT